MGYSIRREHVTHNEKLLEALDVKLAKGEIFTLEPRGDMTPSQVAYQIRNVLKSAETFEEYGYAHLASQVRVAQKSDRVELSPRYGFAKAKVMSDVAAMEYLLNETRDFVTLTFRLGDTSIEDFASALEDWKITSVRENADEKSTTVSFERKELTEDSPFSVLSAADSPDYEDHIQSLLEDAEAEDE